MGLTALLIDITSIQRFVFSSSKLKENLGASFIISDLYSSIIDNDDRIKDIPIKVNGKYKGYRGGGNALYFFNNTDDAEKFVRCFTKSLLVEVPGATIVTAINEWDEKKNFQKSRDELFNKLRENKSRYLAQTIIPRHGLSAECQSDGYSMDVWNNAYKDDGNIDEKRSSYVSAATNAKLVSYKKAKEKIELDFKELLGKEYCFTGDIENLGQSKGSENHIAIVHIDGNSIGDRFNKLTYLEDTIEFSNDVENAVRDSFKKLLDQIKSELEDPMKKDYLSIEKRENGKIPLPIRPIILGGDDITFVCDGRMGIYYATIFMEAFQNQKGSDGKNLELTSCAGIAITKTSYPFYKGYQLSEELCISAKSRRRASSDIGSWLDFHIAYGSFSGSLSEIRDIHYNANLGSLTYRPYKILDSSEYSFETFVANSKKLKKEWPNNKIKELREILTMGEDSVKTFYNEIEARKLKLPVVNAKKYNEELFVDEVTPYFDMIELLEYYPKYELEGE